MQAHLKTVQDFDGRMIAMDQHGYGRRGE